MISFKIKNLPQINQNWWPKTQRQWAPVLLQDQKPYWKDERNPTTGKPWAPLTPAYAASKQKSHPGQPILRRTGFMEDTARIVPRNRGFAANTAYYGPFHQYGTKKMAARPWLGIPRESLAHLGTIALRNIFSRRSR